MNKDFTNLLKSDFYKLSKSKSIIICPIIIALIIILNYIVTWSSLSVIADADPRILQAFNTKASLFSFSSQGLLPLFIAVTISLFIGSDFSYGLTKLSIARGTNRTAYFFSKFIVVATLSTIYTLFAFIISLIFTGFSFLVPGNISGWDIFNGYEAGLVIRALVLNIFVNITASAVFCGISFLCKKQSLALGVNLGVYILGSFIVTMFAFLSSNEQWILEALSFTPYELQSLASSYNAYTASESARIALMPLVYMVLGLGFGLLDFNLKDID